MKTISDSKRVLQISTDMITVSESSIKEKIIIYGINHARSNTTTSTPHHHTTTPSNVPPPENIHSVPTPPYSTETTNRKKPPVLKLSLKQHTHTKIVVGATNHHQN
jgi:hypothetical protein